MDCSSGDMARCPARRWALLLLGALAVAAGCGRGDAVVPAAPPPAVRAPDSVSVVRIAPDSPAARQLRVAPVEARALPTDEVTAPGRVIANPNRIARVLLPAPGRITDVLVGLGASVERGQPVVAIESPDADAAIASYRQAEAAGRQAQAALAKSQADVERARDLYEVRAIAERELLSAQNDLAQARGAVDSAQAARTQAARKLELLGIGPAEVKPRVLVRAPLDGKVTDIGVAPGEYRTDTTAPLMTIADLSSVWVASDVPESAVRLVRVGEPVTISFLAYPGELFTGRVARIADGIDPQTRTLKVYVELPNPRGRLRPEMFGTVHHSGPMTSGPVLSPSAIVQEYGRDVVFVERAPGQFERRTVRLGAPVDGRVPVTAGVTAGDRVVVDGAMLLKDQ